MLMIGEKGEMIRRSKAELGEISLRMWADAKVAGDENCKNLMSIIRTFSFIIAFCNAESFQQCERRKTIQGIRWMKLN